MEKLSNEEEEESITSNRVLWSDCSFLHFAANT